jgi:Na+-translocating ferredoxin:NAD+ oxidoreductase RnfE subunit
MMHINRAAMTETINRKADIANRMLDGWSSGLGFTVVLFPTKRKKKIYSNMFTNHKYS